MILNSKGNREKKNLLFKFFDQPRLFSFFAAEFWVINYSYSMVNYMSAKKKNLYQSLV